MICRIPGGEHIADKDKMQILLENYGKFRQNPLHFIPRTYVIPRDLEKFLIDREVADPDQFYIYKPAFNGEANGIVMLEREDENFDPKAPAVIQEYLTNPLLIKGYKFDLRLYVLVTSVDPLICYMYDDGMARFATTKYVQPTS